MPITNKIINNKIMETISRSNEEWREIKGYEGLYSVSNLGRVSSLERVITTKRGVNRFVPARVLIPIKKNDYLAVNLSKNGDTKCLVIHRLVAEAFIPNPDNKPCIDHEDTDKFNNRVENLRWATYSENNNNPITRIIQDKALKGRACPKKRKAVVCIKPNGEQIVYPSISDVAKDGFSPKKVSAVCNGHNKTHLDCKWKHL